MPQHEIKKILILDDEPDIVMYLEALLGDHGYRTLSARNGRAGMDLTRQEKPDLVTLDLSMSEGSGTRYYRELRSDPMLSYIPVILVTAVLGVGGTFDAFTRLLQGDEQVPPPEACVPKPIDKEEFLGTVRRILSRTPRAS